MQGLVARALGLVAQAGWQARSAKDRGISAFLFADERHLRDMQHSQGGRLTLQSTGDYVTLHA